MSKSTPTTMTMIARYLRKGRREREQMDHIEDQPANEPDDEDRDEERDYIHGSPPVSMRSIAWAACAGVAS